jgi:hypothetical protein
VKIWAKYGTSQFILNEFVSGLFNYSGGAGFLTNLRIKTKYGIHMFELKFVDIYSDFVVNVEILFNMNVITDGMIQMEISHAFLEI